MAYFKHYNGICLDVMTAHFIQVVSNAAEF
jgi:hypothetical protein